MSTNVRRLVPSLWVLVSIGVMVAGSMGVARVAKAQPGVRVIPPPEPGLYRVEMETLAGRLPFLLELGDGPSLSAVILNGPERIEVPLAEFDGSLLTLSFPHYDSMISLRRAGAGESWRGGWTKTRGDREQGRSAVTMRMVQHPIRFAMPFVRDAPPDIPLADRWLVRFRGEDEPSVLVILENEPDAVLATVLTPTGDYRYLAGAYRHGQLRLSTFDGAHAFLFTASMDQGVLRGTFASGTWHQQRWTASPDPDAALPDPLGLSAYTGSYRLEDLLLIDLDGRGAQIDADEFKGSPRIVELFGTWCPNCHDAAAYLSELHEHYGERGLKIVGLAFELTGQGQRDAELVRRYAERFEVRYPLYVAGVADKERATKTVGLLDRVRAYPTFVFIDADDEVRAVYTGFSGPATGDAHRQLRETFEGLIESMLDDAD